MAPDAADLKMIIEAGEFFALSSERGASISIINSFCFDLDLYFDLFFCLDGVSGESRGYTKGSIEEHGDRL